jgi:DNA-binding NarL/FixJ family response regulator
MVVVGEADDEHSAVSLTVEKRPDVVLMDISMPDSGGIEATRRIKQLAPEARILIMTVHEDKGLMQEAIRAGAMGYILKRAIKSELVNAIQAVMRGELYLHPAMAPLFTNAAPSPRTRLILNLSFRPCGSRSCASLPRIYKQPGRRDATQCAYR